MREINATELRVELTSVCNEMMKNSSEYVITRYGERIAILLPYERRDELSSLKKPS